MAKKSNLDCGFLFLYDWLPAMECLPPKEMKALFLALVARQRENKALPAFASPLTESYARMIEPTICRRLEGREAAKRGEDRGEGPSPQPTEGPLPQSKAEQSKEEQSIAIAECVGRACAQSPTAAPKGAPTKSPLTEKERADLEEKGLSAAYIALRAARAAEYAEKNALTAAEVLFLWWQEDVASGRVGKATERASQNSGFDADEFFAAALKSTYGDLKFSPEGIKSG